MPYHDHRFTPTTVRAHILPTNERTLKKLGTRRRRLRSHFGGQEKLQQVAITVSRRGPLIGMRFRVSGEGAKAVDASERYIRDDGPPVAHALLGAMELMLHELRVELYLDAEPLPDSLPTNDPLVNVLCSQFPRLHVIPCPKGQLIDRLRRKLADLIHRPNNEVKTRDLCELRNTLTERFPELCKLGSEEAK